MLQRKPILYIVTYVHIGMVIFIIFVLETTICFSDSSVHVTEDQGSLVFTLVLTNPSSLDIIPTVITTAGTAFGKEVTFNSYIRTYYNYTSTYYYSTYRC